MVLAQLGDRVRVASMDGAEEFPGLTMKLLLIGPDGQAAGRHGEPPSIEPVVRWRRAKEVRQSLPNVLAICSGGLSPVRGREASCTPDVKVASGGRRHKSEPSGFRFCALNHLDCVGNAA